MTSVENLCCECLNSSNDFLIGVSTACQLVRYSVMCMYTISFLSAKKNICTHPGADLGFSGGGG